MSFPRSAPPALKPYYPLRWTVTIFALALAGVTVSCGGTNRPLDTTHNAYVTLPAAGSVRLLKINNLNGAVVATSQSTPVSGLSPTGLVLHPSKKFLYAVNSGGNSVSVFTIASDGTLTSSSKPTPAGSAPHEAVIDPSGQYLLVTNSLSDNISVYSINTGTGALSEVAGSPFLANLGPTAMVITPSGKFVYVTNPLGYVSAFSFSGGVLAPVAGSPFASGLGVSALAVDKNEKYIYAANTGANTVSGFAINPTSGALTPLQGSPYSSTAGTGPSAIAIDPANSIVYLTTQGSSFSIWAFSINSTSGVLTPVIGSPFNLLAAGDLFLEMEPKGTYFYVGNQSTTSIAGYQYNSGSGTPTAITGSPFAIGSAPGKMVIVP
jgi:6-phosphogluconolactonase (cycloisomerase 2 family)